MSAGGSGAFLNQDFAARAFPGVPLDIIDDSGPAIDLPAAFSTVPWAARLPPCTSCMNLSEVYAFDREHIPRERNERGGLGLAWRSSG